jgi:hypothetical protein
MPYSCNFEVEIRASTVVAVEQIMKEIKLKGSQKLNA